VQGLEEPWVLATDIGDDLVGVRRHETRCVNENAVKLGRVGCTSSEYFGQEGGFVKRRFMVLA